MQIEFCNETKSIRDVLFEDDLITIEESFSSLDVGVPNQEDELTRAIFQIQSTLLDHRPLYLQISKNEFAALLLKVLGPNKLTSSVVDDLFIEIDTDNDGLLSVEELALYIIKIEQRNRTDMYRFFYMRLVRASLLGPLAIILANTLAITKNMFIRFNHENSLIESVVLVTAQLGMWLALIASLLFIWGSMSSIIQTLQDTQYQSYLEKVRAFMVNVMTIGNVS